MLTCVNLWILSTGKMPFFLQNVFYFCIFALHLVLTIKSIYDYFQFLRPKQPTCRHWPHGARTELFSFPPSSLCLEEVQAPYARESRSLRLRQPEATHISPVRGQPDLPTLRASMIVDVLIFCKSL